MKEQEKHEMILAKTHPSGADEWYCPTCGRHLLMNYEPELKKTVIEAGDEYAVHSGTKGGLRIASTQVLSPSDNTSEESTLSMEDPSLAPWLAWLAEVDFENLWNDET